MRQHLIGLAINLCLLLALAGGTAAQAGPAPAVPPQAPLAPSMLPVFTLAGPPVSTRSVQALAGTLEGLGASDVVSDTTYAKTRRFVAGNRGNRSALAQFNATGGFFAYDPSLAFTETIKSSLDANNAKLLACLFLQDNQLFPALETTSAERNCDPASSPNLPYNVILGHRDTSDPNGARGLVGVEVQVPLAIDIGAIAPLLVPLAGPGGHLSLLLSSTDLQGRGGLDSTVPGVAAIAEPWYQRQREQIGLFPAVSLQAASLAALGHVRAALPSATSAITLGTPTLTYWVGDPAAPQSALVPAYLFDNATASVDGQEVSVKSFTEPGVQDFLANVAITAPTNGSTFTKGSAVHFTGAISGATGPFTYTWSLSDGTVLGSGTTPGGALALDTSNLPAPVRGTTTDPVLVRLIATNKYGADAEADVLIQPDVKFLFLPLINKRSQQPALAASGVNRPDANYRVGVEWIKNYNGTNPNLSATQPDADHLYSGLIGYGWGAGFRWTDNLAWERDFRDATLGGGDASQVDAVDFAYFSGHGSPTRIYFGVNRDAYSFWGGNARYQHARWVGFSSCQTLRHDTISTWFPAFQGAHMLLGFESVMGDVDFGGPLAFNMQPYFFGLWQMSVREAWVLTAFQLNAGKPAYVYATGNGVDPVDNKLPSGSAPLLPRPYPVSWYYWVWYF